MTMHSISHLLLQVGVPLFSQHMNDNSSHFWMLNLLANSGNVRIQLGSSSRHEHSPPWADPHQAVDCHGSNTIQQVNSKPMRLPLHALRKCLVKTPKLPFKPSKVRWRVEA